jgi:hypothetical protein
MGYTDGDTEYVNLVSRSNNGIDLPSGTGGNTKLKQHVTPKQAQEFTENQFYSLFDEVVPRKDWANYHHKKLTIGKIIEVIRIYYQVDIRASDDNWRIQLFDSGVSTTNLHSCTHEDSGAELLDVLFNSLIWTVRNNTES